MSKKASNKKKPVTAPAKGKKKTTYTSVKDLSPMEKQARNNKFKAQRLASPTVALKNVTFCIARLKRPNWSKLAFNPAALLAELDAAKKHLEARKEAGRSGGPIWPLPKPGDRVTVRSKYIDKYTDTETTKEHLSEMIVRSITANADGKNKQVKCTITIDGETMVASFKPRHLQPVLTEPSDDNDDGNDDDGNDEDEDEDEDDE